MRDPVSKEVDSVPEDDTHGRLTPVHTDSNHVNAQQTLEKRQAGFQNVELHFPLVLIEFTMKAI